MVKLSIIILSYNTKKLTLECLNSIVAQYKHELSKKEVEIVVVDNKSTDDSVKSIKKSFSKNKYFTLIESKDNLGFAGGCNLGAKNAKGECLLFLNSDTEILDKGLLNMVFFLKNNPKVGILGGKLKNKDGSLQPSAGSFYNLFNLFFMLLGFERLGFLRSSPKEVEKVDWVSGACMMIRNDIFKKLSGFDDKLFMYMEDMEICFRAKKIEYDVYFYPDIKLKHKSLGSSNRSFAIINIYKGVLHFYLKHGTRAEYLLAKTLLFLKAIASIFIGIMTSNSDLKNRYKKALACL